MHLSLTFNGSVLLSYTLENTVTLTARDSRTENANSMTAGYHDFKSYSVKIQFTSNVAQQIYNGIDSERFNVVEENGEIHISSVDSPDGSIASNGTIDATISNLQNVKIYIHVVMTVNNQGAVNSGQTKLNVECLVDGNSLDTLTLTPPKGGNNPGIDAYIGYDSEELTTVNSSDIEKGNNCINITDKQKLTIKLTGSEHSQATIKVSIIPYSTTTPIDITEF